MKLVGPEGEREVTLRTQALAITEDTLDWGLVEV